MQRLGRREGTPRRTYRPSLEGLEARDLPSVAVAAAHSSPAGVGRVQAQGSIHRPQPTTRPIDPALIPGFLQTLYGPITTTTPIRVGNQVFPPGTYAVPQPTAAEVKRQTFVAQFVGRYFVGPPRFSNQAETIHIFSNGKIATSNQFLRARAQVLLFPPADPNATPSTNDPVAGRVAGLTTFYPSNTLSTGNVLFLDATNVPGVASNDPRALDHGMPSHLALAFDAVSGGIYAAPEFITTPPQVTDAVTGAPIVPLPGASGGAVAVFSTGTGVLDIKYIPDQHPHPGTLGSGIAIVTVQALINNSGTSYAQAKPIN
jgi:hypothetical protein